MANKTVLMIGQAHLDPVWLWQWQEGRAEAVATCQSAVANDGKYGCDVTGSTMRLTVLRCPPYAYHEPHIIGSQQYYDWVDQGYQEFTLRLCPYVGDWQDAGIVARARALNLPVVAITTHAHRGDRPRQTSLLALHSAEIELATAKAADDGNGYIIRLVDRHGRGGTGELTWADAHFRVALEPFEVATLRLARQAGAWSLTSCDLLERDQLEN